MTTCKNCGAEFEKGKAPDAFLTLYAHGELPVRNWVACRECVRAAVKAIKDALAARRKE